MAARARPSAAPAEPDDDAELLVVTLPGDEPDADAGAPAGPGAGPAGPADDPDDPDDGPGDAGGEGDPDGPGPPAPGGLLVRYDGGEALALSARYTRAGLVDPAARARVDAAVARGDPVSFLPSAVEEPVWWNARRGCGRAGCAGGRHSLLRLHGATRDGAKAALTICGVPIFVDVLVAHRDGWEYPRPSPDEPPPADPEAGSREGAPVPARTEAEIDALTAAARLRVGVVVEELAGRDEPHPPRPRSVEPLDARWFHGYHEAPSRFLRLHFALLPDRKRVADALEAAGFETASDQPTCHYRKFSAESGTPLADWLAVVRYSSRTNAEARPRGDGDGATLEVSAAAPAAEREFWAAPAGVRPLTGEAARAARARAPAAVAAYDIETLAMGAHGDLPRPERPGDHAFMVCATLAWQDDAEPAAAVCVTAFESAPDPRWLTVVAGGATLAERCRNVTRAFGLVLRAFAPDVVADFNGAEYDWPFLVERARQTPGELPRLVAAASLGDARTGRDADAFAYEWCYKRDRRVKLGADAQPALCSHLDVPGWVAVDVRVAYRRLYPKAEKSSLKYFLGLVELPSKADMPIARLWRACREAIKAEAADPDPDAPGDPDNPRLLPMSYYTALDLASPGASLRSSGGTSARQLLGAEGPEQSERRERSSLEMRAVAHYCVVDAARCQSLLVRRGLLADYRAVASRSFTSLADAHYNADGMKVRNAACHYAAAAGFVASHRRKARPPDGKYPGAHVFPPVRGVIPDPVAHAALDDLLASTELAPLRDVMSG